MLYKKTQPFPLREEIEKLKIFQVSQIEELPNSNYVEMLRLNNIKDFLKENEDCALIDQDMKDIVKTDYIERLKNKLRNAAGTDKKKRRLVKRNYS